MVRAMRSGEPPGGSATIRRTGRSGKPWADATDDSSAERLRPVLSWHQPPPPFDVEANGLMAKLVPRR